MAFSSKPLGLRNSKLSAYERELLAIILAMSKWRHYLELGPFIIKIGHQRIKYLLTRAKAAHLVATERGGQVVGT